MFWIWLVVLAGIALIALLFGLRRYERESAVAARKAVDALRTEVEDLRERVQALEAIAASEPLSADPELDDLSEGPTRTDDRTPTQQRARSGV